MRTRSGRFPFESLDGPREELRRTQRMKFPFETCKRCTAESVVASVFVGNSERAHPDLDPSPKKEKKERLFVFVCCHFKIRKNTGRARTHRAEKDNSVTCDTPVTSANLGKLI